MKVVELYQKYNLMPQLITHQLRVGSIVRLITDDRDSILTALVHDMGNLAKFNNLDEHWTNEQLIFWDKYGKDAHTATLNILKDSNLIKLHNYVEKEAELYQNIMEINDLSQVCMPAALTLYGDSRVAFNGVVSLEERIIDLETRYQNYRDDRMWIPKLEQYVQSLTSRDIAGITEQDVEPLFEELLSYNVTI